MFIKQKIFSIIDKKKLCFSLVIGEDFASEQWGFPSKRKHMGK